MKLKRLKSEAEVVAALAAANVPVDDVEVITADGTIKGVRIGKVHIGNDAYTFQVNQEIDHDVADRYRIVAEAPGFGEQVHYLDSYEAASTKRKAYGDTAMVSEIENVKVMVNAKGEVIGEVGPGDKPVDHNGNDIPF